ncbi:hypothetical protein B0H14DRAFT_3544190 [Mycena olivaceomarginata]|nr:hypothetical protein B0H14DRAFT_3544190 [Mycena olivaceomarginata]
MDLLSIKSLSVLADTPDGSFSALEKIIARIRADPGAAAHKFLPVIFANLDPARISDPILGNPSHVIVNLAFNAVIGVALFRELPLPVLRELWPRMWRWIQFVEAHEDYLYQKDDAAPAIFPLFVALWACLAPESPHRWFTLHQASTPSPPVFGRFCLNLRRTTLPLRQCSTSFSTTVLPPAGVPTSLSTDAGGDVAALAALVVCHVKAVVTACRNPETKIPRPFLFGRLCSLCGVAARLLKDDLGSPLLSAGTVGAFTTAMARLHSFPDAEAALSQQSDLVAALLILQPGYPHLPEALKAGLLGRIVAYGADYQPSTQTTAALGRFLQIMLPRSLVYYPVVAALASALPKALRIPGHARFVASPIFNAWNNFLGLAEERLRLFQYFRAPEYIRTKFCDNITCNVMQKVSEMKRCAGCRHRFYCSRECQAFEWKAGHRQPCKSFSAGISRSIVPELNKRDDAFLRLIVHTEYQARKLDILRHQLEYICAHGGEHDFFTLLDYRTGRCEISAKSTGPMVGPKLRRNASDDARHQCRSLVLFADGSAALAMGLHEIWGEIEADTISLADKEEVQMRLRRLCEMKVVETHG